MTLREAARRIPGARWTVGRIRSPLHPRRERPEGPEGIRLLGHREHLGGYWDLMGDLQFDFMVSQGLEPPHYLWDIACGALRAGTRFIAYLEPGHFHGVDRHGELIDAGVEKELGRERYDLKRTDLTVAERPARNPSAPHEHDCFSYTVGEMEELALRPVWKPHFIGAWNHATPAKGMMRYAPR